MPKAKPVEIVVRIELIATLRIPADRVKGLEIDSILSGSISQSQDVYEWGEDKDPARVYLELDHGTMEIEEDGRKAAIL